MYDSAEQFDDVELFVGFCAWLTGPTCREDKEAEGLGDAEEHGERLGEGRGKS